MSWIRAASAFLFAFLLSLQAYALTCVDLFGSRIPNFTENVASWQAGEIEGEEFRGATGVSRSLEFVNIQTVDGKAFSESDLFTDKSDLIIAVDATGNTKGHVYMVIEDSRVDGRMFFAPHTTEKEGWTLSNGLIVRYKGLPAEQKQKLKEWLNSEEAIKSATCVATACKVIFGAAGFEGPGKNYLFPSQLLTFIAKNGLTTPDGQRATAEVYAINTDVRTVWSQLPTWSTVPNFIFKVLFDPYTWAGSKGKK